MIEDFFTVIVNCIIYTHRSITIVDGLNYNSPQQTQRKRKVDHVNLEQMLSDTPCPDDDTMDDITMWQCQVCLYLFRLELRLNFDIVAKRVYYL